MRRILQIVDNISVDSGVSSVIMNIYRNIDKTKIQFDFLVCKEELNRGKSYEKEIKDNGGNIYYFYSPLSLKTILKSSAMAKAFLKKNADKYDAVHLHTPTIALFTLRYAWKYGVRNRIIHSHSTMTSKNKMKSFINLILIACIPRYANIFWACSTEAADFLYGKEFCQKHKIEVLRNAVNAEVYQYSSDMRMQERERLEIKKEKVIVHISNFSPIKNHNFLLPVIEGIYQQKQDIKFVFVGDGPTRQEFEKNIIERGFSKICIFTGRMENVSSILSASDILILPSIKEGLPVTVVEAQACGLRCIISDTITKECNISDVLYLPLKSDIWTGILLNEKVLSETERVQRSSEFCESSFNINREIKKIESLYLNLLK